jgi:phytoene dehydrogenase-like protein
MKYDIIIIGAGLGGLTAGAKLSKEGKKVLLIEQHSCPGGCATTFRRGDLTFEVGLHEMDGLSPGDMKTRIFNDLEVFKHVEFIPLGELYRFTNGRYDIVVPNNYEKAKEKLSQIFPGETGGIKEYFNLLLNPPKKNDKNEMQDKSIGEFLDSVFTDEDLKVILLGNLGYFADDPYSLSLAYYAAAQGSYYTGGSCYIKGGSQKLSDCLAAFIKDHGGEVILNHLVTGIKTRNGKISGIEFRKKNDNLNILFEAETDHLIANNSVAGVADMLPSDHGSVLKHQIREMEHGASLLTLYLGFNKELRELGNNYYSTCVYDSSVRTQRDIKINNRDDFSRRSFIFVDYGQIPSGLAPAGKSVGSVCCIDYLEDWEKLDRQEYYQRKEEVASKLIARIETLIPGVSSFICHLEVATSATIKRYTLNPAGSVYGFAQTPSRKTIDPALIPENLHFASAWGKSGGGFSGAIYGGYLSAVNVLRKR